MKLLQALNPASPARISIVGAGGKTTLAFALAREYAALGTRVLVSTTTAMFHPDQVPEDGRSPYIHDRFHLGPARDLPPVRDGEVLLAALCGKGPKIKGYSPRDLAENLPLFGAVIIEADGAKMKSLKAPAAHEPVLIPESRTLVACIGLDCLDHPLEAPWVHRPEILSGIIGAEPGDRLTPELLVRLAADGRGCFKGAGPGMDKILVFNKADTADLVRRGRELADRVKHRVPGLTACLITCLRDTDDPVKAGWSRDHSASPIQWES